ncbi:MAG: hypothetical protein J6A47_07840 [Bacilli bacterium]|nr:hypothetical protein [Bacilli bacterium]MBO6285898.1 hypothetical protein [Bacilli bacterium]
MTAKTTILALLASVTLAGCGCAPAKSTGQSTAESSHATGLSTSESSAESSHATGLSISESSVEDSSHASGLSSSAAESTDIESSESVSQEELTYTPEQVATDANANLEAEGYAARLTYDSDAEQWWTRMAFASAEDHSEEKLSHYAGIITAMLPDYMLDNELEAVYGDPEAPDYDDIFGSPVYYYLYLYQSPDANVMAWVMSYINSGVYFADMYVYQAVA